MDTNILEQQTTEGDPAVNLDGSGEADGGNQNPQGEAAPNYEELLRTDKALQKLLDSRVQTAVETNRKKLESQIRDDERKRQQKLADARLSRTEKEKHMTTEELADTYKQEIEELRNQIARTDEVRQLQGEISDILAESKIPGELFNIGLDYFKSDGEEIREKALTFAKYEFYPKGEFEKAVAEAVKAEVDAKLKQKPPESPADIPPLSGLELKPTIIY